MTLHICKNCGVRFYGDYCNHCGQKNDVGRLTFRTTVSNLTYGLVNCDRGILFTLRELFLRPGELLRNYIDGKRIVYFRPFSMLIILCGLYGLLMALLSWGSEPNEISGSDMGNLTRYLVPVIEWLTQSVAFWSIALLPFYAFFTKLIFRRQGARAYNFWEMIYIGAFLACQRMVIDIALLPLRLWMRTADASYWKVMIVAYLAVTIWDYRQLFGTGWLRTGWKTLRVFLWSYLTAAIAAALLCMQVVLVCYWCGWIDEQTVEKVILEVETP